MALSFIYENFFNKNNRIPVAEAEELDGGTPELESAAVPQLQHSASEGPAAKDEKEKSLRFENILFQQEKRVAKGWFPSNPKKK